MSRVSKKVRFFFFFLFLLYPLPFTLYPSLLRAEPIFTPTYSVEEALNLPSSREFAVDLLWDAWKKLPQDVRGKTGLVLSGGGARGMAHIGVLRHLEEIGFPVDAIAGASMGAFVGGLYAAGIGVPALEDMAKDLGMDSTAHFDKTKFIILALQDGTASTARYERWLNRVIKNRTFEDTKIPLAVCATDLNSEELVVLREGELAPALLAAATIPGLFRPVTIRQHFLVDGGLLYNVPIGLIDLFGVGNILVSDVSSRSSNQPLTRTPSSIRSLYRSLEITQHKLGPLAYGKEDYALRFFPEGIELFELWRWQEAWEAGLRYSRSNSVDMRFAFVAKAVKRLGPGFFAKIPAGLQ